jgi:hypothetical protein
MYLNDLIRTNGLAYLVAHAVRLDVCSTEPTTYTQATSTLSLGNWTFTMGGVTSDGVGGEKVTVPANVAAGAGTANGTAGFYAITDAAANLFVVNALSAPAAIVSGSPFSTDTFDIKMPKEVSL